jgi:beta-N-acetylglucosaminidase
MRKDKIEEIKESINNYIKIVKEKIKNVPNKIKIVLGIILIVTILTTSILINIAESSKQKYEIYDGSNLNENKYPGYKELIDKLKKNHPNWTFTLLYTRLDWTEVIKNEGHSDYRISPLNLIPDSSDYPDDWRCDIDKDKRYDNGTWVCASDKAIENKMDPRNILNEENIFQFLELKYTEGAQTINGIMYLTEGSFLEGESIAKALIEAGKNANVDPYFITSRLIQEQGRDGTTLSRGYEYNGIIVYNPFNINATGNSSSEIIENAAKYAYEQGWNSIEKALIGGVDFVKNGYIDVGQNTLYLQKFDVINIDGELYTNQYMQNLLAPESEAINMRAIYNASQTIDSNLNFIIPVYENIK